jgi:hypothetical protein
VSPDWTTPTRKAIVRLLLGVLVVGVAAAIVYGASALIVRASPNIPVSPPLALTKTISGYLAALCLGPLAVLGLGLLLGDTVRLLVPARHERLNLELARYRQSVGTDGVTEEGLRYVSAWRDLHRRTSLLLCLFAVAIVPALVGLPRDWSMMAMMVWVVALVILVLWQRAFRCPRCGERFHGRQRTRLAPPFCVNCGLPKDAGPTTAVARDFDEWKKRAAAPAASATRRYGGRSQR